MTPSICRFYVLGKCRYESLCTYSHNIEIRDTQRPTEPSEMVDAARFVDCPFFLRGNCKFGDFCRLRHAVPRPLAHRCCTPVFSKRITTYPNTPLSAYTCGICLDDIVDSGKRFGLLSMFPHAFPYKFQVFL